MASKGKIIAVIVILGSLVGTGILYIGTRQGGFLDSFDPGDRYTSTHLNYMDVIFEDESDLYLFNGGYSASNCCPWVRTHLGLDFPFYNNTPVLAAAPGQVTLLEMMDFGADKENRYIIQLDIRFNRTTYVHYGFEPWTNHIENGTLQLDNIMVKLGDWVTIGQQIAVFINAGISAHIHFDIRENNIKPRPDKYYSQTAFDRMMALTEAEQPNWDHFCFDDNSPLNYMIDPYWADVEVRNITKTFSSTTECPWGAVNWGLNFQFYGDCMIQSVAPGQVIRKEVMTLGGLQLYPYYVNLTIRYNASVQIEYIFKPEIADLDQTEIMFNAIDVDLWEWVQLDWHIGMFKAVTSNAFVMICVNENGLYCRPDRYFSASSLTAVTDLLHTFSPSWNLCYE